MSATTVLGLIVVALAVVSVAAWYAVARRHRPQSLHGRYGSKYDRTLARLTSKRAAEADFVRRQDRVEQFKIRPLSDEMRDVFSQQWHDLQAAFVDGRGRAVIKADALVVEVMRERGYPIADFKQRASDLSVHHASFVQNYRAARDVAERHRQSLATTEELRRAMVFYREMFEDLLQPNEVVADRPVSRAVERDVPVSSGRTAGIDGERVQRTPIAPPRAEREVR